MSRNWPTILTVDDDVTIRGIIEDILISLGYRVLVAADGRAALETIRKYKPDLVLSDFLMGGMNGLELLKRIKAESPEVPVLMFTAFGSEQLVREAVNEGAAGVVRKPFTLEQVRLAVEKALAGVVE
jgi:CheY-like chemotaxis protein